MCLNQRTKALMKLVCITIDHVRCQNIYRYLYSIYRISSERTGHDNQLVDFRTHSTMNMTRTLYLLWHHCVFFEVVLQKFIPIASWMRFYTVCIFWSSIYWFSAIYSEVITYTVCTFVVNLQTFLACENF